MFLNLNATGFEIEAEMTVRAVQAGLRIAEVPSLEMPRRAGKSNLHAIRDGRRVLNTVLRARRATVKVTPRAIKDGSEGADVLVLSQEVV